MYHHNWNVYSQLQHRNIEVQQARHRIAELDRIGDQTMKEIVDLKTIVASHEATIQQQKEILEFERSRVDAAQEHAAYQKLRAEKKSNKLARETARHQRTNAVLQNLIVIFLWFEISGRVERMDLGTLMLDVENRDQEIIGLRAEIDMLQTELHELQKDPRM